MPANKSMKVNSYSVGGGNGTPISLAKAVASVALQPIATRLKVGSNTLSLAFCNGAKLRLCGSESNG